MARVRVKKDNNRIPELVKVMEELNRHAVQIGIFGSDDSFYAMIAGVHEFGMTIRAKGSFLTIPTREAGGRKASEVPGLFKPKGRNVLAVQDGKELKVMFYLVKSVTIPERSFIRSTHDEKEGEWVKFIERQMQQVVDFKISIHTMFDRLGALVAADIQQKITSLRSPPNAPITIENKGSSNPLIDTGGMRARVTWKVVRE